jgi:hypothetical protein
MKARKGTNFAAFPVADPRGNKKAFFRARGVIPEPYSELETFRRKQLKRIVNRGRTAAVKSVSKSASRKSSHSRPSLGDKYIYYTEEGASRSIQLKDISLDSDLMSLLRAEEMDWLLHHSMAK